MIYMQDEYPDGWCIYDGDECLFSGLEEDTACIIVSKINALRAENARLREALAKVQPLADAAKEYVKAQTEDLPQHYYTRGKLLDAAEDYAALANETTTAV